MSNQQETQVVDEQPKELTEAEIKLLKGRRANYYKDQLSYLRPERDFQVILAEIENAKATQAEARLRQARVYAAMTQEEPAATDNTDKTVDHTVTQEDLDINPELAQTNVKVGDVIQVSEETIEK